MTTVLITGATDGIGLALARAYQARGARLVLVGRRALLGLDPSLFSPHSYCQIDLAGPDCATPLLAFLQAQAIERLDVVLHNAGIGHYGPLDQQPAESVRSLLAVNLRAPIALTHALLPLVERADGQLVFISSVASALPAPRYAVYAASKAALDSFASNLRIEQRGRVRVQVIHPGATRTAMHDKVGAPPGPLARRLYAPPERVAAQIVRAVERGHPTVTLGVGNRLLRALGLLWWRLHG